MSISLIMAMALVSQPSAAPNSSDEAAQCGWALHREIALREGSSTVSLERARDRWSGALSARARAAGMTSEDYQQTVDRALEALRAMDADNPEAVSQLAAWCDGNQP